MGGVSPDSGHTTSPKPDAPRPTGRRDRLTGIGSDPDPRFTFANERTFLAWNRTALAFVAAGLAAAELLDFEYDAARLVIALPLIVLGAAVAYNSHRRWEANERSMRLGRSLPYPRLPRLLAYGTALIALVTAALVLIELIAR